MIKPNPFSPQSGLQPKFFGGRKEQIEHFIANIKEAINNRPNHMVILGEWGIGKTSLLKQFKKIAQEEGFLASLCSIGKFTEKDTTYDGINLISEEMVMGFPKIKGVKEFFNSLQGIGISIAGFGGQITRKQIILQPQTHLTELLFEIWKHLETKLAVVLIDDIQNFIAISQIVDILRLVLSKDRIIHNTKYLFVLSSTPQAWSYFLDKHDPIGRFFRKRETISCLTRQEASGIIENSLKDTGVDFDNEIKNRIYKYTEGHPYELQVLCCNLYDSQIEGKVTEAEWENAFKNSLYDLGKDYFEALYRKSSGREKDILAVLAKEKTEMSLNEIKEKIHDMNKDFPLNNAKNYLYRLAEKNLVKKIEKGRFKIIDTMLAEYILMGCGGRRSGS